jgi:GT2 family glycosyltransferase
LTIESLCSLSTQVADLVGGRVVVVDNDSGDGSRDKLFSAIERNGWSGWASVMPLDRNGGFAYGNNAGIRTALASADHVDYVMLLNPDTIVRKGAIKALVGFMDGHSRAGIAGSLLENADGGLECSAHRIHSPLSELDAGARLGLLSRLLHRYVVWGSPGTEAHQCDWVSGASLIMRREVIEQMGPMDDGYFLYFEEADFCWRAKQAGWEVWYVPQSQVMHLEGAATGIRTAAKRRASYWYDSRRRFFVKHYGVAGLVLADTLWVVGRATYLLRCLLRLGVRAHDPKWFMFDLLWGDLRAILTGRVWSIPRAGQQP